MVREIMDDNYENQSRVREEFRVANIKPSVKYSLIAPEITTIVRILKSV
jgi:hypothetical protein